MSTVPGILSTVGGYLEYRGGVQYSGEKIFCYLSTEHPHGTHDIPHMHHDTFHSTQITKDGIPHGTEHPPWYS